MPFQTKNGYDKDIGTYHSCTPLGATQPPVPHPILVHLETLAGAERRLSFSGGVQDNFLPTKGRG